MRIPQHFIISNLIRALSLEVAFEVMKLQNMRRHHLPYIQEGFAQEPFSRNVRQRSWEVIKDLCQINLPPRGVGLNSFGIYISEEEKVKETWKVYRKFEGPLLDSRPSVIDKAVLSTLEPRRWVNDNVVNGYIYLLEGMAAKQTLLLNSWFWTSVNGNIAESRKRKLLRKYVSYLDLHQHIIV